jgi:hypothetical protein
MDYPIFFLLVRSMFFESDKIHNLWTKVISSSIHFASSKTLNLKCEWLFDAPVRQHFRMEGDRVRSSALQLGGGYAVQVCATIGDRIMTNPLPPPGTFGLPNRAPLSSHNIWLSLVIPAGAAAGGPEGHQLLPPAAGRWTANSSPLSQSRTSKYSTLCIKKIWCLGHPLDESYKMDKKSLNYYLATKNYGENYVHEKLL